jgi:hypothetical protein
MTRILIEFSVYGDNLSQDKFTDIIKTNPTFVCNKGDKIKGIKVEREHEDNTWSYNFGFFDELDLGLLLSKFESIIIPNLDEISKYIKSNLLESKLLIVVQIEDNQTPALYFERRILNLLDKLNADIDLDTYVY